MLKSFRPFSNLNSAFSGSDIMELASAWIGDSHSSHYFRLLFNFPALAMCHSAIFISESETIVNALLKDVSFGAPLNLQTYNSLLEFFQIGQCVD